MILPHRLRLASLSAVLLLHAVLFASAGAATAPTSLRDPNGLRRLLAARRVSAQRIIEVSVGDCRPDPAAATDTISCVRVTSIRPAPRGKWVRRFVDLVALWPWVRGTAATVSAPALGVRFQGDSLNVDWVLSLEPLAATLRSDGSPDAGATVPEWNRLEILDLMRDAFSADRALIERLIEQERHRRESEAAKDSILGPDSSSNAYDGCDCFGWPHAREPGEAPCFDVPPDPIATPQPRYPRPAKEAEIQGWVFLHVLIGPDGLAKRIKVHRGITELNGAAVDAVRRWTWQPARLSDRPVCVWIEVPVEFRYRRPKLFHD